MSRPSRARKAEPSEGPAGLPGLPDPEELTAHLHFAPQEGRIWLDAQRMLLLPVHALSALRRELIDALGVDQARALLTRMGYAWGFRNAMIARGLRDRASLPDLFWFGPRLAALEGILSVTPVRLEMNPEKGEYYGEFLWQDCAEVDEHLAAYGISAEPVCWMQAGHACGYTSIVMGRPILFRELECRGMGYPSCRLIGKPAEQWEDAERDLRYLRSEEFVNRAMLPRGPAVEPAEASELAGEMVGASAGFNAACHKLSKVAATTATVLFLGETGVGKEMFAHTLHRISPRANRPFVPVNCAAIPETLMEAELFGVEKGAFTGATHSRAGRFERADGGTLFLDEIGSVNLAVQGKLLRVLQEHEIERVGDTRTRKVDVRVAAAANVDLKAEVNAGRFRADLYYRLNVFPVHIPPLRERRDDIPLLMNHMLRKFAALHGKPRLTGFTERAIETLLAYDYPGNIRELENVIERAVILAADDGPLDAHHLSLDVERMRGRMFGIGPEGELRDVEDDASPEAADAAARQAIEAGVRLEDLSAAVAVEAVRRNGGNLSAAARTLGLTRPQLAYRLRKWKRA